MVLPGMNCQLTYREYLGQCSLNGMPCLLRDRNVYEMEPAAGSLLARNNGAMCNSNSEVGYSVLRNNVKASGTGSTVSRICHLNASEQCAIDLKNSGIFPLKVNRNCADVLKKTGVVGSPVHKTLLSSVPGFNVIIPVRRRFPPVHNSKIVRHDPQPVDRTTHYPGFACCNS